MDPKVNGMETDWARAPVQEGPLWQRIAYVFYNPKEHSFLGRTPRRWAIALAFYAVFYAVLALMFGICMGGLLMTLDDTRPKFTISQSLIGDNPGVAFRPRLKDGIELRYNVANDSHTNDYMQQLRTFLDGYANDTSFSTKVGCQAEDDFGFPYSPCFYIKLNKIFDWNPEYYEIEALPAEMPKDLVKYIKSPKIKERTQIWISCAEEGNTNATKLEYPWGMGLSGAYYPFKNDAMYLSPIVAVKVTPPINTLVTIRCRVWAKNIKFNKSLKDPSGYTRFQVYIEDSTAVTAESTSN